MDEETKEYIGIQLEDGGLLEVQTCCSQTIIGCESGPFNGFCLWFNLEHAKADDERFNVLSTFPGSKFVKVKFTVEPVEGYVEE